MTQLPKTSQIDSRTEALPLANSIVGIGASAGGLTALECLFEQLRDDAGAAYVVIQHLSPDYQSHMAELLGRRTKMQTVQMTEGVALKPNTVYLMPPDKHVEVVGSQLRLQERSDDGELNLPIDRFFRSLSEQTDRSIAAVVLSGTGSDGSAGIVDVHEAGGLVLCQDEDSAQFNGMPLNAIKTQKVHVVGSVPEIAEALTSYAEGHSIEEIVAHQSPTIERNHLDAIYQRLESCCGVDFGQYKHGTFTRRLSRRMMLSKTDELDKYVELLDSDPDELLRLADDLMIGVTRFFRDPDGFHRLCGRCIRTLIGSKSEGDELRVWVAGCATGQEAYSIAMLIQDEKQKRNVDFTTKIFATDVHPEAIRYAQQGIFPREAIAEIPRHLRNQFVVDNPEGFEFTKNVRDSVVFARHDVLQDAPFTNMDLITCRNLLIYLVDDAQARVLSAFTHALRTRGVLWLGPSETPGDVEDQYATLDKHWRLFQKERETRLPLDLKLRKRPLSNVALSIRPRSSSAPSPGLVMTYDRILAKYAPPAILFDQSLHPLQVFGDVSRFTVRPTGRLRGTVEEMLAEPLRLPLAIGLQRMQSDQRITETESAIFDGERVELQIQAFHHPSLTETHYLLSFDAEDFIAPTKQPLLPNEGLAPERNLRKPNVLEAAVDGSESTRIAMLQEQVRMLEMELDYTRENLQATIEEVETTNEELQSSNEELTSSNEELQSTNEELHSVNEELHTTHTESTRRLQLLTELTNDLESVMRESNVGLVLVDRDMTIRRVTPAAADLLLIRRRDAQGESLQDYAGAFDDLDLVEIAKRVRDTNQPVEMEATDRRGDPVLLRVTAYRDRTGVLMTFTNLRSVKETNEKLRKLTSIVADSTDAIIGVELNGRVTSWNRGATKLFGTELDVAKNFELAETLPQSVYESCDSLIKELSRKGDVAPREVSATIRGRTLTLLIRVTPVLDEYERVSAAAITLYDVTLLRAAEEQLRLRTRAIDAAVNGFVIVDALAKDHPIVYANQGFYSLTGFRPEDIVGRNCRFLQGPQTDPEDVKIIREAIAKKRECRVTLLNYRRDGSEFYNDLVITPVADEHGQVTHFVGVQSDVTDVVAAKRILEKSEAEYRSTFENAAIGIAHIGLDGEWLRVNQKLCQIVGYSRDELQSKTFQEITHVDDLNSDLVQFARMKRGEIPGYTMQKRFIHRNGHVVWVNLTTSLRSDVKGNPECCISLVEDISERIETEQKLSASRAIIAEVIQRSDDPFISFDYDGVIQVANRSAHRLRDISGDLRGRSYEELFVDDAESPLLSALDRVRRSQQGETTEYYSRHLSRWYDARVFPVDGGAALYMTDVTGRKETETYLERARVAAEEASVAKSKFLTNMSHEIRSPMSAIIGFSDIALRDLSDGKPVEPEHLETVIRNGRFLLGIINDILDLSKVEAGKLEVRKSRFGLLPMLADINELMRHRSDSSGIPLTFEFASPVVQRVYSDRSRVEQILVNLIGNAIKFTPKGNVRVVVDMDLSDGEQLRFRVIDTGIGISDANLSRLFQTFSQVHDNKIVGVEGTGLGLVISKRLAKILGGDITVESREGKGSCFTLLLPVQHSDNLITPTIADLKPEATSSAELDRLDCRVLVVDDARDVRMVTTRFLSRCGADVVEAVNGAEAVKAVSKAESDGRPFACILMDMQMPELDGRAATERLRNQGFMMPIIALTAGATSEEVQEAIAAGCTEFMAKPVDAPNLIRRVADLTR
ncbi:Autoinducer 2 sensor kinase/phosphatase LuxQ [Rubripirellula amarantea]|uniref:Autoinducer 2 sensor kinase/phosphatase LuxQ n=1 Tax=Rubripirellula amarantea TaxID=2527999 RepID=A0A5C5WTJ7_9BACT|nr:PAS domain S-box protein [Rubripirellula amarantea]TWT53830.1 Autoinducer 2 sensor kinase/phosphatase LuxQ [Rubripirellula amarantea]